MRSSGWLLGLLILLGPTACGFEEGPGDRRVLVAVAANFSRAHVELVRLFESRSGIRVQSSVGSTGQLYAQIRNGAPFDIFLAADGLRPRLLEEQGLVLPGRRFTYAVGRLALFGPRLDSVRAGGLDLADRRIVHVAVANPRTAPYGAAAAALLARSEWGRALQGRLVRGENVSQALQFVLSGAAELGFVALSQVIEEPQRSYWLVPDEYHAPLVQGAVLLRSAAGNGAARQYFEFLQSEEAEDVIRSYGYSAPDPVP